MMKLTQPEIQSQKLRLKLSHVWQQHSHRCCSPQTTVAQQIRYSISLYVLIMLHIGILARPQHQTRQGRERPSKDQSFWPETHFFQVIFKKNKPNILSILSFLLFVCFWFVFFCSSATLQRRRPLPFEVPVRRVVAEPQSHHTLTAPKVYAAMHVSCTRLDLIKWWVQEELEPQKNQMKQESQQKV